MASTSKPTPACPGPRSHQGTPNRGAGARLGAVPGSDFLSPLQLPPESGACPPGSRGHSNRPGRGLRLLGPVPAISGLPTAAQHAANGPGLPGVAHGAAAPPLAPASLVPDTGWSAGGLGQRVEAQPLAQGGVVLDRMPPQGLPSEQDTPHCPVRWGMAQAEHSAGPALPTHSLHPHVKLVGDDELEKTPRARPTRRGRF